MQASGLMPGVTGRPSPQVTCREGLIQSQPQKGRFLDYAKWLKNPILPRSKRQPLN